MFKSFDTKSTSGSTPVKSSVLRAIKQKIVETNPLMIDIVDELLPKKPPLMEYKVTSHLKLYCRGAEPVFFEHRDGPVLPTLRFVHMYPQFFTTYTIDEGAIPYVLGGANIMCPGLTHKNSSMDVNLPKGSAIVIMACNKENAIAVGMLTMSTEEIRAKNKGCGVQVDHCLGDGLFNTRELG